MIKPLIAHFIKLRWLQNAHPEAIFKIIGVEMKYPSMESLLSMGLSPQQLKLIDWTYSRMRKARKVKTNFIGVCQDIDENSNDLPRM